MTNRPVQVSPNIQISRQAALIIALSWLAAVAVFAFATWKFEVTAKDASNRAKALALKSTNVLNERSLTGQAQRYATAVQARAVILRTCRSENELRGALVTILTQFEDAFPAASTKAAQTFQAATGRLGSVDCVSRSDALKLPKISAQAKAQYERDKPNQAQSP